MTSRLRARLQGAWWRAYFRSIRYCCTCGKKLEKRWIREERAQRHVCGACGRITYLNPKLVAGLIPVARDGRVVLLRRSIEPARGKWSYPAGFQEMGETVEEAAARETREEIGVPVKVGKLVGIYSYPDAGVVTMVFTGRVAKKAIPSASPEALEIAAFKPSQIPWKILAFRSTRDALKDWKQTSDMM